MAMCLISPTAAISRQIKFKQRGQKYTDRKEMVNTTSKACSSSSNSIQEVNASPPSHPRLIPKAPMPSTLFSLISRILEPMGLFKYPKRWYVPWLLNSNLDENGKSLVEELGTLLHVGSCALKTIIARVRDEIENSHSLKLQSTDVWELSILRMSINRNEEAMLVALSHAILALKPLIPHPRSLS